MDLPMESKHVSSLRGLGELDGALSVSSTLDYYELNTIARQKYAKQNICSNVS
jgi:hypothetical protein